MSSKNLVLGTGARATALLSLLGALVVLSSLPSLISPARAQGDPPEGLTAVGPVNPETGYPYWYEDANGVRLDLCLDPRDQLCLQPFESPDPTGEVSFPDNFPGESFWWSADAEMDTGTFGGRDGDAQLGMAAEAAFLGEEAKAGEQMGFGRIRIRVDNLVIGEEYTVTHPYGTDTFIAEDNGRNDERRAGEINVTEDLGCASGALAPCKWDELIVGDNRVGPFLTWTEGAPEGYVGNPNVAHEVTGSPYDTNVFRIEGPNVGPNGEDMIETDLFNVSGKLASPQATATVQGETYNAAQEVEIVSSDPEATVYYTTDPQVADEDIESAGTPYGGETITIEQNTDLRFVAVNGDQRSEVYTESYVIDTEAPHLTATPEPVLYEPFEEAQEVTLQTSEPADIYYTTDGSDPKEEGNEAREEFDPGSPLNVSRSQTIKAYAEDAEENQSRVETFDYKVASLSRVGPNNEYGYPEWLEDANGNRLELCLDPQDQTCIGEELEGVDPNQPISFPDNFPGESFWWTGEAEMPTGTVGGRDGDAELTMASEAAFAVDRVRDGEQIGFGRIRIRIDNLVIGEEYKVTHPYGTDTFIAEDNGRTDERRAGEINFTEDIGCMMPVTPGGCNYDEMRFSRVGPFLTWDPNVGPAAPEGYVGDPNQSHEVVGSPVLDENGNPQNYFRVEGPNVGPNGQDVIETDLFNISGKHAELRATPSVEGGTFNEAQQVELTANDPEASIVFTTDGTDPEVSFNGQAQNAPASVSAANEGSGGFEVVNGTEYTGPINISETTELRYIVVNEPNVSKIYSQNYVIDTEAPTLSADPEAGEYQQAQEVTLNSNDEDAKIHYTTDGSEPTTESPLYEQPINVGESQTIRALAVDAAGNRSGVESFEYTIEIPATETGLEFKAEEPVPTYWKATQLNGKLTSGDGEPVANREITILERTLSENRFSVMEGEFTTDDNGNFSAQVRPKHNSIYRAVFRSEDGTLETSASAPVRVSVRAHLTVNMGNNEIKAGQRVAMGGVVRPEHAGDKVELVIKRGQEVMERKEITLDNRSVYKNVYRAPTAGNYMIRAIFPGDDENVRGSSEGYRFKATR